MMPLFSKPHTFDLDGYLSTLRERQRRHWTRPAQALPWVDDGLQDWPSALAEAERIVGAMAPPEKHNPEGITPEARARISSASGTDPDKVDRLVSHFLYVRRQVLRLQGLRFWQRLKLLTGRGRLPLESGGADA